MPHQISSLHHQTVVSVLREAAQVNADVEACVNRPSPASAAGR
jgi:hypothetical protein